MGAHRLVWTVAIVAILDKSMLEKGCSAHPAHHAGLRGLGVLHEAGDFGVDRGEHGADGDPDEWTKPAAARSGLLLGRRVGRIGGVALVVLLLWVHGWRPRVARLLCLHASNVRFPLIDAISLVGLSLILI